MADEIHVTFHRPYSVYNTGESASFQADIAQRLISRGTAVQIEAPKKQKTEGK